MMSPEASRAKSSPIGELLARLVQGFALLGKPQPIRTLPSVGEESSVLQVVNECEIVPISG